MPVAQSKRTPPAPRFFILIISRPSLAPLYPHEGSAPPQANADGHIFGAIDNMTLSQITLLNPAVRQLLHRAVTFDADFAVYRFGPGKRRAFTIVS